MKFEGDFEKLDDEIKVQLKSIKQGDMETFRRLRAQELSADDQALYLMTDKQKKELHKDIEEEYDTDLERTLY